MSSSTSSIEAREAQAVEPDPKRWLALTVIAISQLLIVLDGTVVNIALPTVQEALDISTADRQWALTAYTLSFGGLLLLGGRIADYTGRKRAFIIGLIGFAAASALGGLAQNAPMFFGARALQGAFAALMAPAALALLTVVFTKPKERAMAFGIYGAIAGGGSAVGLLVGGVLTEYASWRWTLLISTPIAIAAAFATAAWVRESRAHGNTSYDLPGAITSTLGLVALVYAFTKAAPTGPEGANWGSPLVVTMFAVAAVFLTAFVVIEARSTNPLLPLRVLRDRNRGGSYLIALIVGVSLFGTFLFLSYYLQQTLGYSTLKSGVAFLPFTVGIIAGAMLSAQIMPRVGPRIPMVSGLVLATVGMLLLTRLGVDTGFWSHVFPAELIMAFGMGVVFGPLTSTALVGVAEHDAGVASALVNTAQQVGGSVGLALLNTISISAFTTYLADNRIDPQSNPLGAMAGTVHGYSVAFFVSAGLMALAAVLAAVFIQARAEDLHTNEAVPALG
ncbi:MAG TPA: MFS transporter [Micromonosporaceae bacterium]|nr:MFS transporter [Micromonosporaceae bacterium]